MLNRDRDEDYRPQIIYIAGNGHSGSTLLDMMVGASDGAFSAGELTHIARVGITEEYCSCGSTIGDCPVWKAILKIWSERREISLVEFRRLRRKFELNRTIPRLVLNLIVPNAEFAAYCRACECLLDAIVEVTGAETIIDSSKSAARIRILHRFSRLRVVRLFRNFTGVMNSVNRSLPKNVEAGVETDLKATPPGRALFNWIANNFLVLGFSIGISSCKVHYSQLVRNPEEVLKSIDQQFWRSSADTFSSDHMLAGNAIRLKKNIRLDAEVGRQYRNLSDHQIQVGKAIDSVFWFWSK